MTMLDLPTASNPVKVIHGDCMEVLRSLPPKVFDCVVTSPPYNLNKKASGGGANDTVSLKEKYRSEWYADEMPEPEYQVWQKNVVAQLLRVTDGSVFYNHKPRYAWHGRNAHRVPANVYHPWDWLSGFPIWCEIIWDRGGVGSPNAGRFPIADERIYQIGKPKVWNGGDGWSNVWRINPERGSDHPCPFPIEIPRRCILSSTLPGDLVLDPFGGSGTTAVAAISEGRRCLVIEADPKFCDIIRRRVDGLISKLPKTE